MVKVGVVDGEVFRPDTKKHLIELKDNRKMLNTCKSFEPLPRDAILDYDKHVDIFNNFLCLLFDKKEVQEHFKHYLSHLIWRPEERPHTHWVIRSETGIGKDTLRECVLEPLFCCVEAISFERFLGKFSATLHHNLIVQLNEVDEKSNKKFQKLKDLSTCGSTIKEKKQKDEFQSKVYARLFIFSNKLQPYAPDSGVEERRFILPPFKKHFQENKDLHFEKIKEFRNYVKHHQHFFWSAVYLYIQKKYYLKDFTHIAFKLPDWESIKEFNENAKHPFEGELDAICEKYEHCVPLNHIKSELKVENQQGYTNKIKEMMLKRGYKFQTKVIGAKKVLEYDESGKSKDIFTDLRNAFVSGTREEILQQARAEYW